MKPPFMDELEGNARSRDLVSFHLLEQGTNVSSILRSRRIIARENLQREEVPGSSDRHALAGDDFEDFRFTGDFALDSGRGEEQIDDHAGNSRRVQIQP